MNSIILYSSKTGNTEKIANYMAKELNINCINLKQKQDLNDLNLNNYDLIFIGSGVYGGRLHKDIINFLNSLNLNSKKKFAFFISWFGRGKSDKRAVEKCTKILTSKNQVVHRDYYKCFGQGFKFFRKNHPNDDDLRLAIKWAKKVMIK